MVILTQKKLLKQPGKWFVSQNLKVGLEWLIWKDIMRLWNKFFNKHDIPWVSIVWEKYYPNGKLPNHTKKVSFWWRENLKLLHTYKSMAVIKVQNGQTYFFWTDGRRQQPLKDVFPELFSYVKTSSTSVFNCSFQSPSVWCGFPTAHASPINNSVHQPDWIRGHLDLHMGAAFFSIKGI